MNLEIAVLVKQVPRFEEMSLGLDGRLKRDGIELEMNPYCRRAVTKGVELAREKKGRCTVITLGPSTAEDCLREAIAWGADQGILLSDSAFAGSDTLATARALAGALERFGPFDLVLAGRNSVDADTGQVGAELAALLDLPMLAGVRALTIMGRTATAECELDDGWLRAEVELPALMTCAERLCEPCKVDPQKRAEVSSERIERLCAADLGAGPFRHGSGFRRRPMNLPEHRQDCSIATVSCEFASTSPILRERSNPGLCDQ
jgi:electron transfer flavoprotein alpha subunit